MHQLQPGDELIIGEAWGAIEYKGPGYFIAGGAGITPFIAIFRELHKENKAAGNMLFFSNKTAGDIICEQELFDILGGQAIFILTKENNPPYVYPQYVYGYIDNEFIEQNVTDFQKHFYVCGPDQMVADIVKDLEKFNVKADSVVFEK